MVLCNAADTSVLASTVKNAFQNTRNSRASKKKVTFLIEGAQHISRVGIV